MTTKTNNTSAFVSFMMAMLAGIQDALPAALKSIPINGNSMTLAQLEAALQAYIAEYTAVQTAKVAYAKAVSARKADEPAALSLMKALEPFLKLQFGSDAATLAKFGITLKTPAKRSVANKALGLAKSTATRKAKQAATPAPAATALNVTADGVELVTPAAGEASAAPTPPSVSAGAASK